MDDETSAALRFFRSCERHARRAKLERCQDYVKWAEQLSHQFSKKDEPKKASPRRHRRTRDEEIARLRRLLEYHKHHHEATKAKLEALVGGRPSLLSASRLQSEDPSPSLLASSPESLSEASELPEPVVEEPAESPLESSSSLETPESPSESPAIVRAKEVRQQRLRDGLKTSNIVGKNVKPECRGYRLEEECGWPCAWIPGVKDKRLMCRPAHRPTKAGHQTPWGKKKGL